MKIREYQFPESNKKQRDKERQRDPMIKPQGVHDKFIPPVVENDPLETSVPGRENNEPAHKEAYSENEDTQSEKEQRVAWKAKRKRKRQKRQLRRLVPVLAGVFLVIAWLFLRLTPVSFGTVLIDGNEKMTFADVYRVSGVQNYVNIIQLSPADMQQKLSHDLRIADVKVSREFPATIHVRIEERKAAAVITTMYGFAYVDQFGVVMDLEPQIKGVSAPLFTGKKMDTLLLGDVITDNTIQAALGYLQNLSPADLHSIAEVNVGNPEKIVAYTTDSIPIRLGDGDNPAERARITGELLQEVQRNQLAVQYIDTDVNAPLVKSK